MTWMTENRYQLFSAKQTGNHWLGLDATWDIVRLVITNMDADVLSSCKKMSVFCHHKQLQIVQRSP